MDLYYINIRMCQNSDCSTGHCQCLINSFMKIKHIKYMIKNTDLIFNEKFVNLSLCYIDYVILNNKLNGFSDMTIQLFILLKNGNLLEVN